HRHGTPGVDVVRDLVELGERLLGDRLDEDVEDATAGQAHLESVVVADPVPLEHRRTGRGNVLGEFVDRTLDASTRDGAGSRAVVCHHHRRTGRARSRTESPYDRGHAGGPAGTPGRQQVGEHLTHRLPPPTIPRTPPSSAQRPARRHAATPRRSPLVLESTPPYRGAGWPRPPGGRA